MGREADGSGSPTGGIYICHNCYSPTFFTGWGKQFPAAMPGGAVENVPQDLYELYNEARKCCSTSSYTACVLLCRKMLMNISVSEGAKEGKSFMDYVTYLSDRGFIPPNGKHWVDHIRTKGNEATHQIAVMSKEDAEELIIFTEMLLRFIYEFPSRIPQQPQLAP